MNADQLTRWAAASPWASTLAAGLLLLALITTCYLIIRRVGGSVFTAGLGALICTAYSADTSWRFARDHLGMHDTTERLVMFGAGEGALLACAVMARASKKATATDVSAGTPGVPGVLVWCITSVQLVPAFAESGFWAGIVRAAFGPVMAALLWHEAMGLEIRINKPKALSSGLLAQIGHELRERLLSYLGVAVRGRTAAQVTRDRATARAVRLASRRWLGPWGRAALKASVARSAAGTSPEQRQQLLLLLAARRSAAQLRTLDVTSPWTPEPAPEPHPATPLGVTGAELRRMDPIDAILHIRAAHPDASPAELASLSTEYGIPVTDTQVRIALHPRAAERSAYPVFTVQPRRALAPAAQPQPDAADGTATDAAQPQPDAADGTATDAAQPQPDAADGTATDAAQPQPDAADSTGADAAQPQPTTQPDALILDLAPMLPPHLDVCAPALAQTTPPPVPRLRRRPVTSAAVGDREVVNLRLSDEDAELLERAKKVNLQSLQEKGQMASQRRLERELSIGQRRAKRIYPHLPTTLAAAVAEAQPHAKEA
ncbi:hypothetical protein [Streptomyces cavernae]|uniref:hypothetical protein n=1 Tax=Streptomyces cavernae TaxID=2259034 RepID=UPI000FEBB829|nr:hypothetical protein [Streptomyces cavernae]